MYLKWLQLYKKKLEKRNARVQGFTFRFLIPRYLKSLLLLPTIFLYIPFLLSLRQCKTIIYRPSNKHTKNLERLKGKVLVIGKASDKKWAKSNGYDFIPFIPIYLLCNFGISKCWEYILDIVKPKRLLIWTDYGLDQYLSLIVRNKKNTKVWCIQHGLFPSTNNQDLDGIDADINLVASHFQKQIMLRANYNGKVIIYNKLFEVQNFSINAPQSKDAYQKEYKIIFVGAGYNHDKQTELNILMLITNLQEKLPKNYHLIYRPHPRDKTILKEISKLKIPISNKADTSIEDSNNLIFVGIKSTYLLEAQLHGKLAILITSNNFPRYFEPGEIKYELADTELQNIENVIYSNF